MQRVFTSLSIPGPFPIDVLTGIAWDQEANTEARNREGVSRGSRRIG